MLLCLFRRMILATSLMLFVFLASYSQYRRPTTVVPGSTQDKIFDNADRIHREATQKPATYNTPKPITNTNNSRSSSSNSNINNNTILNTPKPTVKEPDYYQREAGSCICNSTPYTEVKFARTDQNANNIERGYLLKSKSGEKSIVVVPRNFNNYSDRIIDVFYVSYTSFKNSGKINNGNQAFSMSSLDIEFINQINYPQARLPDIERRVMDRIAPFLKQNNNIIQFKVKAGSGLTTFSGYRMYVKTRDSVFIAVPNSNGSNKGNIYLVNLYGNYYNETGVLFMPYEVPAKEATRVDVIEDVVNNKLGLETNWRKNFLAQEEIRYRENGKKAAGINKNFNNTIESAAPYTLMKYGFSPSYTLDSGYKLNLASKDSFLIAEYYNGNGYRGYWKVLLLKYEYGEPRKQDFLPQPSVVIDTYDSILIPGSLSKKNSPKPLKSEYLKKIESLAIKEVRNRLKNYSFTGIPYVDPACKPGNEYYFGIVNVSIGDDYMGVFALNQNNAAIPTPQEIMLPGVVFHDGKIGSAGYFSDWGYSIKLVQGLYRFDNGIFSPGISSEVNRFGKPDKGGNVEFQNCLVTPDGSLAVRLSLYDDFAVYKNDNTKITGYFPNGIPAGFCKVWTTDGKCTEIWFENGVARGDIGQKPREIKNPVGPQFIKKNYANGDEFVGEFVNGRREGYGILKAATGNIYKGKFTNDTITSPGIWSMPNGTHISGNHVVYPNGEVYYGKLQNGKREGPGFLLLNNGNVHYGIFKDDDLPDGNGMVAFKNGDLARGTIKNGKLEGDVLYIDKAKRTATQLKFQNGTRTD